MNPCLILHDRRFDSYEAYNDHGRLICRRSSYSACQLAAQSVGYDATIFYNSRLGRSIRDKVQPIQTNKR